MEFFPDCCKNHKICKAVDNDADALEFISNYFKTQKMYNKAFNYYHSTMQFAHEYYKIQEMCDKAVSTCFFVFNSVPDRCKTQNVCDRAVSENPFMLKYCLISTLRNV